MRGVQPGAGAVVEQGSGAGGGGLQEVLGGLAQGSEAGPVLLEALVVGGNCHELERGGV